MELNLRMQACLNSVPLGDRASGLFCHLSGGEFRYRIVTARGNLFMLQITLAGVKLLSGPWSAQVTPGSRVLAG